MSAEKEIVFTELLLLGVMKQAMINKRRSGGGVAVCFRKTQTNCTIPFNATLRGQCIPGHGLAFRPLVDLLFAKMNGPLLTSFPKKAYSGNGNLHRSGSLRI